MRRWKIDRFQVGGDEKRKPESNIKIAGGRQNFHVLPLLGFVRRVAIIMCNFVTSAHILFSLLLLPLARLKHHVHAARYLTTTVCTELYSTN